MNLPSDHEILATLDRLSGAVADDLESPHLEFKPWTNAKDDMRVAVEYAVCFANAEGGVIVFGVADKTRGRASAIHGAKGYDLDVWRRGIFDATRPHLPVEVSELAVPEGTGRLLLVRVPAGENPPYGTAQGVFKQRIGKNCMPLDHASFQRGRIASGALDWSGQPAHGVRLADLDPVEMGRARAILRGKNPESDLLRANDADFLKGLGAMRAGQVTHTGLLLFGQAEVIAAHCPQAQVHYVHQPSDTAAARNDQWRVGLLLAAANLLLLGVGLAATQPRRATNWNLLLALLSFIVYFNLINLSQAWVASGKVGMGAVLLVLHGGMLLLGLALIWWRNHSAVLRLLPRRAAA